MDKNELTKLQRASIEKRRAELEKAETERAEYLESEQCQRDEWERYQDLWERSFAKKGLHYQRKPFVSALQRQQAAEQTKQEEIAYLRERLHALETQ